MLPLWLHFFFLNNFSTGLSHRWNGLKCLIGWWKSQETLKPLYKPQHLRWFGGPGEFAHLIIKTGGSTEVRQRLSKKRKEGQVIKGGWGGCWRLVWGHRWGCWRGSRLLVFGTRVWNCEGTLREVCVDLWLHVQMCVWVSEGFLDGKKNKNTPLERASCSFLRLLLLDGNKNSASNSDDIF